MSSKASNLFFATCLRGLEPPLQRELQGLGLRNVERQVGGVAFSGDLTDAWKVNLTSRVAGRVLKRMARFRASNPDELYAGIMAQPWHELIGPDHTLLVASQTNRSELDHTHFIEQRTKDAVCDQMRERFGRRPSVDKLDPDLRIHVHLYKDRATLSLDTTGEPLYKRGWRVYQGPAPLSESLASGLLALSGWDGRSPLIDPFCGSGTILVEAALKARGFPASGMRQGFAFERLNNHDDGPWQALRKQLLDKTDRSPRKTPLIGRDVHPLAVQGALENLEAAGIAADVEIEQSDGLELEYKPGWNGWIVTNPPYGLRLGSGRELENTYTDFGRQLKQHCVGYHLGLITGNEQLFDRLDMGEPAYIMRNGAIDCGVLLGRVATAEERGAGAPPLDATHLDFGAPL